MAKKIVSQEDCYLVIKKCVSSGTFEIVNFKVNAFEDKEREYYKSDSILKISAKISKNISRFRFFLKKFNTKHAAIKELLVCVKSSEREIVFYENYLLSLTKTLPNYEPTFVPGYLLGKVNDCIILEDMSLKSYVMAKKANRHLLDRFHICLALNAIAKLHAGSLCYEEIKLKNIKGLFENENLITEEQVWKKEEGYLGYKILESGLKGIKTLLAQLQQLEQLDESLCKKIDELGEVCLEIIKPQTQYRNVLCHNDLQTKNLLFKYQGTSSPLDCVLLNFGFCRYFLPAYDVLTLIFFTTSKLFRQNYFTYLIQYYHDSLHTEMVKHGFHVDQVLSFEDLKQSINYIMPLVKLRAVLHLQESGARDGFYNILQKDDNAYRHFLYEDKSEFLSEVVKKDPLYKIMMIEALEELLDTLNDLRVSREDCYEILEKRLDTTVYDLHEFYLNPNEDGDLELIMSVCVDYKEGTISEFKYLVEYDTDNGIKVVNQIQ